MPFPSKISIAITVYLYLFVHTAYAASEDLTAATANWQPFAFRSASDSPEPVGIAVEITKQILLKSRLTAELNIFPANRLNKMLNSHLLDINFADSVMWNDRNTRKNFLFSEPYMNVKEYLYFLEGASFKTRNFKDLTGKRIGISIGYYYELLEDRFNSGELKKVEVTATTNLINILMLNRVDAIAMDNFTFLYLLQQQEHSITDFYQGPELSNAPMGFKIQKEHQDLLPRINLSIKELTESGEIGRTIDKYYQH